MAGVNSAIDNFIDDHSFTDQIADIIYIEERLEDYIIIGDYHVPLPVVSIPDLVFRDKDGKIRIVDHKTCSYYSKPEEINLKYSTQAVVYINIVESILGESVDRFHFIENKITKTEARRVR